MAKLPSGLLNSPEFRAAKAAMPKVIAGRIICPRCRARCHQKHYDAHWQRCNRIPDKAAIRRLAADGMSQQELAEMIGASESWLQRALKRLGYAIEWTRQIRPVPPPEDWRAALCGTARGKSCGRSGNLLDKTPTCKAGEVCQIMNQLPEPWIPCEAPDDIQVGALLEACWAMPGIITLLEYIGADLRPLVVAGWALVLERMPN